MIRHPPRSTLDRPPAASDVYKRQPRAAKPPPELQAPRTWRTRPDPLEKVWPEAKRMLETTPELEARALVDHFLARPESGLQERHLRTFFRRVQHWRATAGPEKEVFFAQVRKPGELMQLDWTHARELEVTIQGALLDHLLCHCVLPYSNWEWATRCVSESFLSLVGGLQAALGRLERWPAGLGAGHSGARTPARGGIRGGGRAGDQAGAGRRTVAYPQFAAVDAVVGIKKHAERRCYQVEFGGERIAAIGARIDVFHQRGSTFCAVADP